MSWLVLSLLIPVGAGLIVCAFVFGHNERYINMWANDRIAMFWSGVIVLLAAGILGGIMLGRGIDRRFAKESCEVYGEQTDRQVRWIDASYFDYGCYVLWDGRWVERDDFKRITFGQETGGDR